MYNSDNQIYSLPKGTREIIKYQGFWFYECNGIIYKEIKNNNKTCYQIINRLEKNLFK